MDFNDTPFFNSDIRPENIILVASLVSTLHVTGSFPSGAGQRALYNIEFVGRST